MVGGWWLYGTKDAKDKEEGHLELGGLSFQK